MLNVSEHNIEHQKINLDQKIRSIAKDEAKKMPRGSGGGGGLGDAPKDGKQYARKDNNWVEVVSAQEETDPVWTSEKTNYSTTAQADALYQPKDGDLTAIAGLSGTSGFAEKTAANTWVLTTLGGKIHGYNSKTTPVDNDELVISDSDATYGGKKVLFSNLKSTLQTANDALYSAIDHDHDGVYAPVLGADDNYVTDAEKIILSNTSGENTGDQDLSPYQIITKTVLAKTDDYTVLETDNGKIITMDSTSAKTFTITDGYAVGTNFTLAKLNTGRVTIQMSGSETVWDSTAGGTLYSYFPSQIGASVTIAKASTTKWIVIGPSDDWTTT